MSKESKVELGKVRKVIPNIHKAPPPNSMFGEKNQRVIKENMGCVRKVRES